MNKKRLLKMADFVEGLPKKEFNMDYFGCSTESCGFVGCAMGWAAKLRKFKDFKMERDQDGSTSEVEEYSVTYPNPNASQPFELPLLYGFNAVQELFGITYQQASYLFGDDAVWTHHHAKHLPPTPKRVAARIRKFVQNEGEY